MSSTEKPPKGEGMIFEGETVQVDYGFIKAEKLVAVADEVKNKVKVLHKDQSGRPWVYLVPRSAVKRLD